MIRSFLALMLTGVAVLAQTGTAFMPPQSGTFNGSTRGYWFIAPVSFTMTSIQAMPQTGSTAILQNFAVVRFDNATPPPTFSATTNAFTQLALGFDQPAGVYIPINVVINAGDVIGVYGNRTTASTATTGQNSYGSGVVGTSIDGIPVTLNRSGMQFHLGMNTSPAGMHDLWQEPTSPNITRVEFTYAPVPEPGLMLALGGFALVIRLRRSRQV